MKHVLSWSRFTLLIAFGLATFWLVYRDVRRAAHRLETVHGLLTDIAVYFEDMNLGTGHLPGEDGQTGEPGYN